MKYLLLLAFILAIFGGIQSQFTSSSSDNIEGKRKTCYEWFPNDAECSAAMSKIHPELAPATVIKVNKCDALNIATKGYNMSDFDIRSKDGVHKGCKAWVKFVSVNEQAPVVVVTDFSC